MIQKSGKQSETDDASLTAGLYPSQSFVGETTVKGRSDSRSISYVPTRMSNAPFGYSDRSPMVDIKPPLITFFFDSPAWLVLHFSGLSLCHTSFEAGNSLYVFISL
jgi:hypothetical protein